MPDRGPDDASRRSPPMRVAMISAFPPNPQGEANYAGQVVAALAAVCPALRIHVVALRHPDGAEGPLPPNVTVERVVDPEARYGRWRAPWRVLRAVRAFAPDVVHCQHPFKREFGGFAGETMLVFLLALRLHRIPCVVTLHNTSQPEEVAALLEEKRVGRLAGWLYRTYLQVLYRTAGLLASRTHLVSAGDASPASARFAAVYGLSAARTRDEPHPCSDPVVMPDREAAREALGLDDGLLVLATGFVRPDKGFDVLLAACAGLQEELPRMTLVVAGLPERHADWAHARALEAMRAESPQPERIRLQFEFLPDEVMRRYIAAADLLVLPYRRTGGASGPLHTALGLGKPTIATAIGQNVGLADQCLLVPPNDVAALATAIRRLLSTPTEASALAQRARAYATRHTWPALATTYLETYRLLVPGRGNDACG